MKLAHLSFFSHVVHSSSPLLMISFFWAQTSLPFLRPALPIIMALTPHEPRKRPAQDDDLPSCTTCSQCDQPSHSGDSWAGWINLGLAPPDTLQLVWRGKSGLFLNSQQFFQGRMGTYVQVCGACMLEASREIDFELQAETLSDVFIAHVHPSILQDRIMRSMLSEQMKAKADILEAQYHGREIVQSATHRRP